ncbi:hypothetical protein ACEPAH_89 [Sanghuangporus vaninii]
MRNTGMFTVNVRQLRSGDFFHPTNADAIQPPIRETFLEGTNTIEPRPHETQEPSPQNSPHETEIESQRSQDNSQNSEYRETDDENEEEDNGEDESNNNSEQTRASSHPTHISAPRTNSQSPQSLPSSSSSSTSSPSSSSSMATQHTPVFSITNLDLKDLVKAFDGVEKLQLNGSNFKMWIIRVETTMRALGLEDHLSTSPPDTDTNGKNTNNQLISVLQSKIPDSILSNMIGIDRTPAFIHHLKTRFDVRTTVTSAVEVSKLFNIRGHVAEFDKTLDKLQNIYGLLVQHNKTPTRDTYLSAIQNSTPPQYGYVFQQLQARIDFYNSTRAAGQASRSVTPDDLIAELRAAFANYQAQKQPSSTPSTFWGRGTSTRGRNFSHRTHYPRSMNRNLSYPHYPNPNYPGSHAQWWKGPWDNRNSFRGRGRGRSNFNPKPFMPYTHAATGAPQCFNCKKYGHMSKDCRVPPTPQTIKIRQSRTNNAASTSMLMQASTNYINPNVAAQAIIPSYALPPSNTARIEEVNMTAMHSQTPVLSPASDFPVATPARPMSDSSDNDDVNENRKCICSEKQSKNPFQPPAKRQENIAMQLASESSTGTNYVDDFWKQMMLDEDPDDDSILLEDKSLFDMIHDGRPIPAFAWEMAAADFIEEHGYHPRELKPPMEEEMQAFGKALGAARKEQANTVEHSVLNDVPIEYVQSVS